MPIFTFQGSPLPVTLFQIVLNEINMIFCRIPKIEHCLCADDVYILTKEKDNATTWKFLGKILQTELISQWQ